MPSSDPTEARQNTINEATFNSGIGYTYPNDLGSNDNEKIIRFNFFEYSKASLNEFELANKRGSISLILPPELSHSDSLEYNDFDGGFEASIFAGATETTLGDWVRSTDAAWARAKDVVGSVASLGFQSVAGNAANISDVQTGRTLNPRVLSKFERVGFKAYQFTWTMIAKDSNESKQIKKIIDRFRKNAHPEIDGQGAFFKFPSVVDFEFLPGSINEYLWKPEPCAITGVNVTYNASGTPKFFKESNAPVEVVLSVQLKELLVKTSEDFLG